MSKLDKFLESYDHYRNFCGIPRWLALYRAAYYEIWKKEPWA